MTTQADAAAGKITIRRSGPKRVHLTKEDWLEAALEELNLQGIDAVKVLPLSKKLGVTRGSFYWHFDSRSELLTEMLKYWEQELTDSVIHHAQGMEGTPRERLHGVLSNVLINHRHMYDTAIAAWGMSDATANSSYSRVMRKRQRFLSSLIEQGGVDWEEAQFRARLLLGYLQTDVLARSSPSPSDAHRDVNRCLDMAFA